MPDVVSHHPYMLGLKPGERVRVRSAGEIFSTLDEDGALDGTPFMPEMLRYCGHVLSVDKRADKTCSWTSDRMQFRRVRDAVHLSNVRCDGSAHGGCQAACLMYWKEAWLERVGRGASSKVRELGKREHAFVENTLSPATQKGRHTETDEPVYRCQATDVDQASTVVSPWQVDQYIRDARNWSLRKVVRGLLIQGFNTFQRANRKLLPRFTPFRGGLSHPPLTGQLPQNQVPSASLNLQPGDLVRIKSKDEIMKTLDHTNHNRGLSFDVEMLTYCGRQARVLRRVDRLIDEVDGKMIHIKSDCIILEGVVCTADYHRFCTRSIYPYWREVWLERIDEETIASPLGKVRIDAAAGCGGPLRR